MTAKLVWAYTALTMKETKTQTASKTMTCPRCAGNGGFKEYSGIWNGICFKCEGAGVVTYKATAKPRKPTKAQIENEAARLVRAADSRRKTDAAMVMYANDQRLAKYAENSNSELIGTAHPYYYAHATELAQYDGVWASL